MSSFGSLHHFTKEKKPAAAGGAVRCLECPIERDCPYSAKKSTFREVSPAIFFFQLPLVYLDRVCRGETGWPVSTLVDGIPDLENVTDVLRTGAYGRCVYESDNNVCDHQVRISLLIPKIHGGLTPA